MSSRFNQEQNDHEPHPWLEEKVYTRLRQRTVDLVRRSVDALRADKQRVSLATVTAKSKENHLAALLPKRSSTRMGELSSPCWFESRSACI